MTDDELTKLEALVNAATRGLWEACEDGESAEMIAEELLRCVR